MCGRGACTLSAARCCRIAGGSRVRGADRLRRRFNLGPQGYVPVVRCQGGDGTAKGKQLDSTYESAAPASTTREVSVMRWGLVPAFAKRTEDFDAFRGGSSTFNARIESAETSGLWRRLLNSKRGVVLFDGFYEWRTSGKTKTPMFIRNRDDFDGHSIPRPGCEEKDEKEKAALLPTASQAEGTSQGEEQCGPGHAPLMFAALFDVWYGPKGSDTKTAEGEGDSEGREPLESVTILTMEPDGTPMAAVHNRMPVFLTPETAALWLDHSQPFAKIAGIIVKASQEHAQKQLLLYEVSSLVSSLKNESPDCILPKKQVDERKYSSGLGRFFGKPSETKSSGDTGKSAKVAVTPAPLMAGGVLAACQQSAQADRPPSWDTTLANSNSPSTPNFGQGGQGGLVSCLPTSHEEEEAQLTAALAASTSSPASRDVTSPTPAPVPEELVLTSCRPASREEEEAQLAAAMAASLAEVTRSGVKRPAEDPDSSGKVQRTI